MSNLESSSSMSRESKAEYCPFCSIAKGHGEASVIESDDDLNVIVSLEGTPLIFPHKHITAPEEDPELAVKVFEKAIELIPGVVAYFKTDDYNIVSNTGKFAGQEVPHFHVHILPRFEGDKLVRFAPPERKTRPELETIAEGLRLHFEVNS